MVKDIFYKTIYHFFPEFSNWLINVKDPRRRKSCVYKISIHLWVGILIFVLKLGSRRKIDLKFKSEKFLKHLSFLGKEKIKKCLHNSTLAYLLRILDVSEIVRLRYKMIKRLIRNKVLSKYRLYGYYLIIIDMTKYISFRKKHCNNCIEREVRIRKGKRRKIYLHPVVEAKIVGENGFVLSIGTEFVENIGEGNKQDCELKATYRLLGRLKKDFPQLRICLLLDSLYINEKIISICEENNWKYIIVFKKGSAPELWREYEALKGECSQNYLEYNFKKERERQFYNWVEEIDYKFEGRHYVNVLECKVLKKKTKKGKTEMSRWLWITNFSIDKDNCMILANKGGRLRWKIENEGFNMQKNGGYNMEHPYIENLNGAKCIYLLMQIAHIINQLIEKGSLLSEEIRKYLGSIKEIAERLLEELRTSSLNPCELERLLSLRIQIRFDSS